MTVAALGFSDALVLAAVLIALVGAAAFIVLAIIAKRL